MRSLTLAPAPPVDGAPDPRQLGAVRELGPRPPLKRCHSAAVVRGRPRLRAVPCGLGGGPGLGGPSAGFAEGMPGQGMPAQSPRCSLGWRVLVGAGGGLRGHDLDLGPLLGPCAASPRFLCPASLRFRSGACAARCGPCRGGGLARLGPLPLPLTPTAAPRPAPRRPRPCLGAHVGFGCSARCGGRRGLLLLKAAL